MKVFENTLGTVTKQLPHFQLLPDCQIRQTSRICQSETGVGRDVVWSWFLIENKNGLAF